MDDNEEDVDREEEEEEEVTKLNVNTIACRPNSETSLVSGFSVSSSSLSDPNAPMCKICHMNAKENDPLISPCRCSGTMQYMHCGCLMVCISLIHTNTNPSSHFSFSKTFNHLFIIYFESRLLTDF